MHEPRRWLALMPTASLRPCRFPRCPLLVAGGYCDDHKRQAAAPRPTAAARGYDGRWQKARRTFLSRAENALCQHCKASKRLVSAVVVDHVIPHKGNQALFWDSGNWQPLCTRCHNAKSAKEMHDIKNVTDARKKCDGSTTIL